MVSRLLLEPSKEVSLYRKGKNNGDSKIHGLCEFQRRDYYLPLFLSGHCQTSLGPNKAKCMILSQMHMDTRRLLVFKIF